jgi:hypothetical protein
VQLPEGTVTVSPEFAEFIAVCTSEAEQDDAATVLANALMQRSDPQVIETIMHLMNLAILNHSSPNQIYNEATSPLEIAHSGYEITA